MEKIPFPGIPGLDVDLQEILRIRQLPETEQEAAMAHMLSSMLGINFDLQNPQNVVASILQLKQERDQYLYDCRVMTRIALDLGKVFGVVEKDDTIKDMTNSERVAAVLKTLTKLIMVDAPAAQMPGKIGEPAREALKQKFLFLAAIAPMKGKYNPVSAQELEQIVSSVKLEE